MSRIFRLAYERHGYVRAPTLVQSTRNGIPSGALTDVAVGPATHTVVVGIMDITRYTARDKKSLIASQVGSSGCRMLTILRSLPPASLAHLKRRATEKKWPEARSRCERRQLIRAMSSGQKASLTRPSQGGEENGLAFLPAQVRACPHGGVLKARRTDRTTNCDRSSLIITDYESFRNVCVSLSVLHSPSVLTPGRWATWMQSVRRMGDLSSMRLPSQSGNKSPQLGPFRN